MTLPNTTVSDIMTQEPIVVHPGTSLKDAIKLIAEHRVMALPVVDNNEQLVGMISEADLMWQETGVQLPAYIMILDSVIYLQNPGKHDRELHKALGQTVQDVMTKSTVSASPDQLLQDAVQIMHSRKFHHLPIVDADQHVVGILTLGDIVRFMAKHYSD